LLGGGENQKTPLPPKSKERSTFGGKKDTRRKKRFFGRRKKRISEKTDKAQKGGPNA